MVPLRSELRYKWARHTMLTRLLFGKMWPRQIYLFRQDLQDPLTYHSTNGVQLRPKNEMETDLGSVPVVFQLVIAKDQFIYSYFLHDSGYEDHGMWMSCVVERFRHRPHWLPREADTVTGIAWHFVPMEQWQVDGMLHDCVGAEDGMAFHRQAIWRAVRAGGRGAWEDRECGVGNAECGMGNK
jgi:hypothetical protein